MKRSFEHLYLPLVVLGILSHIAVACIPANSVLTPWSGGGDMYAYILLGRNLVSGYGYSYATVPSAWRTPGYPLVIAAAMRIFGAHFVLAVRSLQAFLSILAAYFCSRASRNFFGDLGGKIAFLVSLFFPTLIYFSGEFLSESLTAFFVSSFLWMISEDSVRPTAVTAVGMGLAIGFGALFRPNVAAVGLIAMPGAFLFRRAGAVRLQFLLIPLCAGLLFVPWIVRNYYVFGRFLVTTKSGTDALCGALNPESRFLPGWEDRMRALVGHLLPNELETNSPSRLALGSEIEIDQRCWRATRKVWKEMSMVTLMSWTLGKWGAYWLSTDQLIHPGQISPLNRFLHVGAVAFYWVLLVLGCLGWRQLIKRHPVVGTIFLIYAALMTLVHTPFVMDTRIRSPLIDPLVAVLAGGCYKASAKRSLAFYIQAKANSDQRCKDPC